MNINEIDKFRNDFFEKLIKEEKEKERIKQFAQKNCYHTYNIMGFVTNGYQERTCCKCNHTVVKSVRIWKGTQNGTCIIS